MITVVAFSRLDLFLLVSHVGPTVNVSYSVCNVLSINDSWHLFFCETSIAGTCHACNTTAIPMLVTALGFGASMSAR